MTSSWGEEFQRLVLACAIRGDLLDKMPLVPELFGGGGAESPRQRIAASIAEYHGMYGTRPSSEALGEMLRRVAERLGPEEREVLAREVAQVLRTGVPDDPRFVLDSVREQVELRAIEQGMLQARDLLAAGPSALPQIRELLVKAAAPVEVLGGTQSVSYFADSEERLAAWRRGDEYGERVSTGFPALDSVLEGGPTRREVWYFLAPPKGAKTASLLHVARAASRQRLGVYVATYEMQAIRMALRLDRTNARRTKAELVADLTELERQLRALKQSGAGEIHIDERPPQRPGSVVEAASRVQQIRRKGGRVDVVVLDYLNIMGSSQREREKRHELSRVSRDIATMAKELDVVVWSAALVNRAAVNKAVIRKTDIAEAFEVIAVADGVVAICGTKEMVREGYRRFYVAAAREEADEARAGDYKVDFSRMTILTAAGGEVDSILDSNSVGNDRKKEEEKP